MTDSGSCLANSHHITTQASEWVQRWCHLATNSGDMLDLACGSGRHMQWFKQQRFQTTGVDRDPQALLLASQHGDVVQADLENAPWPLMSGGQVRQFDVVVVTNYLWRALFPVLLQSLAPGGLLLYETFALGHENVGRPARPDFLLRPGELLQVCQDLHVIAYENGFLSHPDRFVQRIAATQQPISQHPGVRFTLSAHRFSPSPVGRGLG